MIQENIKHSRDLDIWFKVFNVSIIDILERETNKNKGRKILKNHFEKCSGFVLSDSSVYWVHTIMKEERLSENFSVEFQR